MFKRLAIFTAGTVTLMSLFGPSVQAALLDQTGTETGTASGFSLPALADIPGVGALADAVGFARNVGEQAEAANQTWAGNFAASCIASVGEENADLCDIEWVTPEPGATAQESADNRASAFERACIASVGAENADLCATTPVTQEEAEVILAELMND